VSFITITKINDKKRKTKTTKIYKKYQKQSGNCGVSLKKIKESMLGMISGKDRA